MVIKCASRYDKSNEKVDKMLIMKAFERYTKSDEDGKVVLERKNNSGLR